MVVTTRLGGFSKPPFDGLNLSGRVGDDPDAVKKNRRYLYDTLTLPAEPIWLDQQHGHGVLVTGSASDGNVADATIAFEAGFVCAVTVADCLPILLCDKDASRVAAIHAGWRGLAAGIVEQTIKEIGSSPRDLIAWLGPAIGPDAFQVGDDVRDLFITNDENTALAFLPDNTGYWMADLYQLARICLQRLGVKEISGGCYCTYHDSKHFYSYRRSPDTGRMAALAWLESQSG